jgi:hypothetical protein
VIYYAPLSRQPHCSYSPRWLRSRLGPDAPRLIRHRRSSSAVMFRPSNEPASWPVRGLHGPVAGHRAANRLLQPRWAEPVPKAVRLLRRRDDGRPSLGYGSWPSIERPLTEALRALLAPPLHWLLGVALDALFANWARCLLPGSSREDRRRLGHSLPDPVSSRGRLDTKLGALPWWAIADALALRQGFERLFHSHQDRGLDRG